MTKEERANLAKKQVERRSVMYKDAIANSILHSSVYRNISLPNKKDNEFPIPKFEYLNMDTVSAFFKMDVYENEKICMLNFASFKHPGGGYLKGSNAQEEALCAQSTLYNILSSKSLKDEYSANRNSVNIENGLYENWAIYTPDVVFESPDGTLMDICDVITCPAPNKTELLNSKIEGNKEQINRDTLDKRIEFMLDTCFMRKNRNVNTLIIGAWGSGVFGQNVNEVAELFDKHLRSGKYKFDRIVVAVPEQHKLDVFIKQFEKQDNDVK